MRKFYNIRVVSVSLMLLLLVSLVAFSFIQAPIVYAENTDVIIDLSDDSLFDAYNDSFVYTYGTSLYVVSNNTIINLTNAFEGSVKDIAMNASSILVLTTSNLYSFDYSETEITSKGIVTDLSNVSAVFVDGNGKLGTINSSATLTYLQTDKNTHSIWSNTSSYSDYAYTPETNYAFVVKDKVLSRTLADGHEASFTTVSQVSNVNSISSLGNYVYANCDDGLYRIDSVNLDATVKLGEIFTSTGKITSTLIGETQYIFAFANKSIVQYLVVGNTVEYYNKFDNSAYTHPTEFNIIQVAKISENANVYSSPRNKQITARLNANDLVLVLCEVNSDVSEEVFYRIATEDGSLGYIKKSAITENDYLSKTTDATSLKIGLYAQGLHESTNIYKYPYQSSEVLSTVTIYDQLVVLDNVAELNNNQVWNYFRVSYVDKSGSIITGYVKVTDVSPYTALQTPKILKSVKIKADTVGESVYIYTLPDKESPVVGYLTDAAEIDLAEEYNEDSLWTKVIYNGSYAYIPTANLQQGGLTSLQITLIVISCLVLAATATTVSIILYRKRMGY